MEKIIIAFGLLYFVGHVLTHVFDRMKIPDVLILIFFGILIGPVFGIISTEQIGVVGELFTSIALIIILFEGGLNLEMISLWRSARQALMLTVTFFFVTAIVIFCILYYGFDYSPMASVLTGFICGGTSSAVVIPMIGAMKAGREVSAVLILESALTDVLCIVFTIGVLRSFQTGAFEVGKIIGNLLSSLILASVIGAVGGLFWTQILNRVRSYPNTQFATFAFMFIVFGIAEMLDFSGAIAALAFGVVLGNHQYIVRSLSRIHRVNVKASIIVSPVEKELYKEIVFLIKIFFFIYLGISIPFEQAYIIGIAFTITASLYLIRPLAAKFLVTHRVSAYDRTIISVMIPKGLAAAVLAGLPAQYGMVEGPDIQAITYNVVLISIVMTSVLIPLIERTRLGTFYKRLLGSSRDYEKPTETKELQ